MILLDLGQESSWFEMYKPFPALKQSLCPPSKPIIIEQSWATHSTHRARARKTSLQNIFFLRPSLLDFFVSQRVLLTHDALLCYFIIQGLRHGLQRIGCLMGAVMMNVEASAQGWFIVESSLEVCAGCATREDAFHQISFAFTRFLCRWWLTPLMRHPQDSRVSSSQLYWCFILHCTLHWVLLLTGTSMLCSICQSTW